MPVNATIPANTAMPMFRTVVRQICTYGNMAGSELFCVRVALLRNKYASILRVMSLGSTCFQNCQDFFILLV